MGLLSRSGTWKMEAQSGSSQQAATNVPSGDGTNAYSNQQNRSLVAKTASRGSAISILVVYFFPFTFDLTVQ